MLGVVVGAVIVLVVIALGVSFIGLHATNKSLKYFKENM